MAYLGNDKECLSGALISTMVSYTSQVNQVKPDTDWQNQTYTPTEPMNISNLNTRLQVCAEGANIRQTVQKAAALCLTYCIRSS